MKTFKQKLSYLLILSALLMVACSKNSDSVLNIQKTELGLHPSSLESVLLETGIPLRGSQEVPANASMAKGSMDVSYNKSTKLLKYTVRWLGLTGNAIGAHIHGEAAPGLAAPVKHPIVIPSTTSGELTDSVVVNEVTIKEADLLKGLYYLNIHTPLYPGGEIRGQIVFKTDCDKVFIKKGIVVCGSSEVPKNNSKGSGTLDLAYNKTKKELTYTLTWKGLSSNAIAAHIHGEAAPGKNAPVVHPLPAFPPTVSGSYSFKILIADAGINEAGLLDGLYYINIHTALFASGEIRAQLKF